MEIANIHDAKTRLSKLVERALAGEEVVIARAGTPLVRLVPVSQDDAPRQGGQWKGRVRITEDFDTLPDEIAAAFGIEPRVNLLLDTHVLLWWLDDPGRLSTAATKAIRDGRNGVYVSAAVAWEITVKAALGKLDAPDDLEEVMAASRFLPLPITVAHALAVRSLADLHRDPFDRILVAQALHEGHVLVTRDPEIARYPVRTLLA